MAALVNPTNPSNAEILSRDLQATARHLHSLPITPPMTIKGLDHLILKPKKFDRVVAVNVDEVLRHLLLALSKQSQP
jgi:hypothetical protein